VKRVEEKYVGLGFAGGAKEEVCRRKKINSRLFRGCELYLRRVPDLFLGIQKQHPSPTLGR
jgi:hypothetical protein